MRVGEIGTISLRPSGTYKSVSGTEFRLNNLGSQVSRNFRYVLILE